MKNLNRKTNIAIEKMAIVATRWIGSTASILVHTILFIVSFLLYFMGVNIDQILLVVTTIVSLEAIYLSIFIQMSVNRQTRKLRAVARDVDEIQEDIDEIQEDIDEIQEDVEDIQEEDEKDDLEKLKEEEIMTRIEDTLGKLIEEVLYLKNQTVEKSTDKKE